MKFLVIGLGSMGKRRIRNLMRINSQFEIYGLDKREDRRNEAQEKYGIKTFCTLSSIDFMDQIDAFIISVPPDKHMEYAHFAYENGKHSFIEASVVNEGIQELIDKNTDQKVVFCPSCTLRFHPSIKLIKELIEKEMLGKLSNFSYHSGQYLPDWHPWEDIQDFYVSNPETGGCREIVPFEMSWLNWVFGDVKEVFGFNKKTINLGVDIDDTYASVIYYESGIVGTLIVDVVSRNAVRKLVINGDQGQILWDWDKKYIEFYDAKSKRWVVYHEPAGAAESGYNVNIIEEMYIEEIRDFIDAFMGVRPFSNNLQADLQVLNNLYGIEKASSTGESTRF